MSDSEAIEDHPGSDADVLAGLNRKTWRWSGVFSVANGAFALAAGFATTICAVALSHDKGSIFFHVNEIAGWFNGGAKPEVVTWPSWGYAWLIALLPSLGVLLVIQAGIGVVALTALSHRLRVALPQHRTSISVLLILAVPWHAGQADFYPNALAGSFALISILCLDRALARSSFKAALAGGFAAGLSQNFRTEFVLIPLFVLIAMFALMRLKIMPRYQLRPVLVYVAFALALQIPWAMFYHAQTGRYSLTESNLGHVLYVSLGSDPNNPWSITKDDLSAQDAVRQGGFEFSSLSDDGSKFLLQIVKRDVRNNPAGFVKRTVYQLKNTLAVPFYWWEPRLGSDHRANLDILREDLKNRIGVAANERQVALYKEQGVLSSARRDTVAMLALGYQFATAGTGALIFLLSLFGMAILVFRRGTRPTDPLLWLFGLVVLYKAFLDIVLNYGVEYLSNVYPLVIPFACVALSRLRVHLGNLFRRVRGTRPDVLTFVE